MSNEDWKTGPRFGIPPQKDEPKDVREMRRIINRAYLDCPIINRTECMAMHLGLSGEDKYTLLAYYALLEVNRMHKTNMQLLMLQPLPSILIVDPKSP